MKLKEKFSDCFHDVYYRLFPGNGVEFAMKCKDVTARIDLGEKSVGVISVFRFHLHLTLCRACRRYYELSEALGKAIRASVVLTPDPVIIDRLNATMIEKYSKKPS